jgi:hypothetical protein
MDMPLEDRPIFDEEEEVRRLLAIRADYERQAQRFSPWKIAIAGTLTGFGLTTAAIVISITILHTLR